MKTSEEPVGARISLVLLPGMDGTGNLFDHFIAELPEDMDALVVPYAPDKPQGYGALEGILRKTLAHVPGPYVLVAESFSGPLAIRMVARPRRGMVAAVLVATFLKSPVPGWFRYVVRPGLFKSPPPGWWVRRYLSGAAAPEALIQQIRQNSLGVMPEVLHHRMREVLDTDVREALARAQLPVLVLDGARDRLVKNNEAQWASCPQLQRRVLDAPHLVLQLQPKAAVAEIVPFVRAAVQRSQG